MKGKLLEVVQRLDWLNISIFRKKAIVLVLSRFTRSVMNTKLGVD
jgi:hypothetical protein